MKKFHNSSFHIVLDPGELLFSSEDERIIFRKSWKMQKKYQFSTNRAPSARSGVHTIAWTCEKPEAAGKKIALRLFFSNDDVYHPESRRLFVFSSIAFQSIQR